MFLKQCKYISYNRINISTCVNIAFKGFLKIQHWYYKYKNRSKQYNTNHEFKNNLESDFSYKNDMNWILKYVMFT